MESYTLHQWLLFFFTYCFFGWIWESCFVSVRQGRWVNRGFLHGPMLPIYGFGAVIILLATIPVAASPALVFLCGMVAATLLEYGTGWAMERIFGVRYWDYSKNPLNLNGYICLGCSLGWGVFSLLLIRVIHPPIQQLLLQLPGWLVSPLVLVLTVVFTADTVQSCNAAMDLKKILAELAESNEDIRRVQKRLEVVSAFAEEDLQQLRDSVAANRQRFEEGVEERFAQRAQSLAARKLHRRELLTQTLARREEWKLEVLDSLSDQLASYRQRLENSASDSAEALARKRAEVAESLEQIKKQQSRLRAASQDVYARSARILRANPSAQAKKYAEALEELRRLSDSRK
ncbi:MAG: hypothetical protein RRY95_05745 [Oscillospiraceae bacterium]